MSGVWHCPVCKNGIDANFGMVQCSQCQTVLFVDFSGNIIIGEEESSNNNGSFGSSEEMQDIELSSEQYLEVPMSEEQPFEFQGEDSAVPSWNESSFQPSVNGVENEGQPTEMFSEDQGSRVALDSESDPFPALETPSMQEEVSISQFDTLESPPKNYEDISPVISATGKYQIFIDGIDSASLRRQVLESLRDHRLGLVNDEISEQILNGRLVIVDVNAITASFIINTLKGLPVELNWQVYASEETTEI